MIDIGHKALAMLRSGEADVYYDQLVALIDALEAERAACEWLDRENERLRAALDSIARMLAPGNRTLDELMRDMGYACDRARRALNTPGEPHPRLKSELNITKALLESAENECTELRTAVEAERAACEAIARSILWTGHEIADAIAARKATNTPSLDV